MALTITEQFRMEAGGKQWRTFTVLFDETCNSVAAASIELTEIEAIVGVVNAMSFETDSCLVEMHDISIKANGTGLIWLSTVIGTQTITVIGW